MAAAGEGECRSLGGKATRVTCCARSTESTRPFAVRQLERALAATDLAGLQVKRQGGPLRSVRCELDRAGREV